MPKVTVGALTEKFELKSAPPDGYVVLRRMTYGQKLQRLQNATQQIMRESERNGQGGNRQQRRRQQRRQTEDVEMDLEMKVLMRASTEFEFKCCIVGHNLQDENDALLDFSNPATLDVLDPRVGDEISQLIEDMNNFEEDEEEAGPKASTVESKLSLFSQDPTSSQTQM